MLEALKPAVLAGMRRSGLPGLIRKTTGRWVTILVYHDPSPETLDEHLAFLDRRYEFISLDQLVDAMESGRWDGIPRGGLILTFDDGHRGNFALREVVARWGVRPTVYLCSGIAGTTRRFWFMDDQLLDHLAELKRLPHEQRVAVLEQRGFGITREHDDGARQALSREEIELMRDRFDFQAHTRFHPILPTCSDRECEEEIGGSKPEVETLSGRECRHFCYPNGDYGAREQELVEKAGYSSARTIDPGWNRPGTSRFALKAMSIPDDASLDRLAADLSGFGYLRFLRLKLRRAA